MVGETQHNYLVLLELVDTSSLCYKHIVAYYKYKDLEINKNYQFTISKERNQRYSKMIEEERKDTIYVYDLKDLPQRLPCIYRVLVDPQDYEYSFTIKSVNDIIKN